jgi:hypothetical protein
MGGRMESVSEKNVSFEAEQMDLDEKFEELKKPVYKGKNLDDPISSPVVCSLTSWKLTQG